MKFSSNKFHVVKMSLWRRQKVSVRAIWTSVIDDVLITLMSRQKIIGEGLNEQKQILFNINIQFSKTIALTKQFFIQTEK